MGNHLWARQCFEPTRATASPAFMTVMHGLQFKFVSLWFPKRNCKTVEYLQLSLFSCTYFDMLGAVPIVFKCLWTMGTFWIQDLLNMHLHVAVKGRQIFLYLQTVRTDNPVFMRRWLTGRGTWHCSMRLAVEPRILAQKRGVFDGSLSARSWGWRRSWG